MSIEGKSFGKPEEDGKPSIQLTEKEFRRVQRYANEHGISNEEAAVKLLNKGGHILKGIIEKTTQKTKERKYGNIQNKRQQKRQE